MYRYFLALRYLLSRPINLLGMAGVMVGVWALILVVSIFSGFLVQVRAHVKEASSDVSVLGLPAGAGYSEVAAIVRDDANVADCAPRLVWFGLVHAFRPTHAVAPRLNAIGAAGLDSPLASLLGIDPGAEGRVTGFAGWIADVEDPERRVDDLSVPLRPRGEVPTMLVSERRLETLFVGKGGRVKVTSAQLDRSSQRQPLIPIDHELEIAGAYKTKHTAFDTVTCFVHIDVMRDLLKKGADAASEIVVRCIDPSLAQETAERLQRVINDRLFPSFRPVRVHTWLEMNAPLLNSVDHQRGLMKLVLIVIMVVAAFLLYATLSMMVTEKTHDIGILTALGATRRGVMQVFLSCGLAIAVLGAVLGIVTGCLSSYYLDDFNKWLRTFGLDLFPSHIYNLDRVPYDLDPVWIGQVALMALVTGVVVSGLPAWRAARHDPLSSLRNE